MTKHTPGKWEWWTSNSWRRLRSEIDHGRETRDVIMPMVNQYDHHPDLIVSEADMRLIAAAPQMLEALKAMKHAHRADIESYEEPDAFAHKAWAMMEAALAAAEPETDQ